jgi:LmbE family N-acetylglucosaminyl deacetylase
MQHRSGLLVVSPHFDDGVFGCGCWLAASPGARVLTVFAALPEAGLSTSWDQRCGFALSREAVLARHLEDDEALAGLDAVGVRLPFFDSQYERPASAAQIAASLGEFLRRSPAGEVAFPLGLFHSDHRLVSDAACLLMREEAREDGAPGKRGIPALRSWYVYADAIYRRKPGAVEQRLAELGDRGFSAQCIDPARATHAERSMLALRKAAAIACYASQLDALGHPADLYAPERYWRLCC